MRYLYGTHVRFDEIFSKVSRTERQLKSRRARQFSDRAVFESCVEIFIFKDDGDFPFVLYKKNACFVTILYAKQIFKDLSRVGFLRPFERRSFFYWCDIEYRKSFKKYIIFTN